MHTPRHPEPHDVPDSRSTVPRDPYEELGSLAGAPGGEFPGGEEPGHRWSGRSRRVVRREARREARRAARPEPHDTRRAEPREGRRWWRLTGLSRAAKTVVALAVLTAFVALADRWAVLYAEGKAADTIKNQLDLAAAPEVEIGGFPFVDQLVEKKFDSVRVTVPDVPADRVSLQKVSAMAHDVRLDADGLTSVHGADIPELEGDVLLSFDDLSRELGSSQITFRGEGGDKVRAGGTLPVAGQDLRVHAEATVRQQAERGIATDIGNMRLDIGDLATYRPGTRPSEGLHLTRKASAGLAEEDGEAKALLSVPSIAQRLGVPEGAAREGLGDDGKLAELTGSPHFAREARNLDLIDLAEDDPAVLGALGISPDLLDALTGLTRPVLADKLSLAFQLPEPPQGDIRLRDVRVEKDGIRVRLSGSGLSVGG
ncbi:DUF2993 domain-containing protein [Streptomyces sp. NPDC048301]|uniref:LmeA family phospholipid-binding protein n=1 Tax=Streptomyces sp. NPDC048301 TaxID=3155631 RepID=UPI0034310365